MKVIHYFLYFLLLNCFQFLFPIQNLLAQTRIDLEQQLGEKVIVSRVKVNGNKKTKDYIVSREMAFRVGDTLKTENLPSYLDKSEYNLINTSLFNYVHVGYHLIDSSKIEIEISVTEKWYIWPIPIFEYADPNFNTWLKTKDFERTNYGVNLKWLNFRGRNQELRINGQWGYLKDVGVYFFNPQLRRNKKLGGGFEISYAQNNEITVGTENNVRKFFTSNNYARDIFNFSLFTSWRAGFYNSHVLAVGFNSNNITDSITRLTNDYFVNNQNYMQYVSWWYTFRHSQLDNKDYPLEGRYIQADITWNGFPVMPDNNLMVIAFKLSYKSYVKLANNLFFAANLKGKYTPTRDIPYYFQQGLGYKSEFVRGYEYYVLDGQSFALFKSNMKYRLFKSKVYDVKKLKNTSYAKVHSSGFLNFNLDAGYVFDVRYADENPLNNTLIYGAGVGFDMVALYDKVVRFEYSLNNLLEHGFFIHFVKPI